MQFTIKMKKIESSGLSAAPWFSFIEGLSRWNLSPMISPFVDVVVVGILNT